MYRRKPHLQGRFSGRLATKDDEKRLNTECRLLGPLLGGVGKRGDGSRLTLAKIVRGIAAGDVRKFCEERERTIKVGRSRTVSYRWVSAYVGSYSCTLGSGACSFLWSLGARHSSATGCAALLVCVMVVCSAALCRAALSCALALYPSSLAKFN